MKRQIHIVIAENQSLLRKALVACVSENEDMSVIGEARTGRELLDVLKFNDADIVLLDLQMPVMDGWEALDVIKRRFAKAKVIIVTNNDDLSTIHKVASKGADGFVSKNDEVSELILAIRDVYYLGKYYKESLTSALVVARTGIEPIVFYSTYWQHYQKYLFFPLFLNENLRYIVDL